MASFFNSQSAIRVFLAICLATLGCTRGYYRQQADGEVYNLLRNGIRDPRWQLSRINIDPHPTSRFYDPDCPDHPPMPPDDPVSHEMMHCVDCKAGYPCWHSYGDKPFVENIEFRNYLPFDAQGNVVLNREGAVQLALVNSRDFQTSLEELYLSALEVTQQRFEFDMQFFARNQTFFSSLGRRAPGAGGESRSILSSNTNMGAERLFSTGALLTAELANSYMWQFSGPNTESVNTLLTGSLVQPLLRNAGRDFFLEGLTLQERLLLANIRTMQRYRQGFYLQIVAGVNPPQGPQRGGSGFGGASAGFFGVAGLATSAGGGGGNQGGAGGGGGVGAAQAGGYLGLLQDARQIANLRANVAGLRRSLDLLEALFEANRIDRLQVDQARQQLFNQQSTLLTTEANYQLAQDNFKNLLGLPPCLPLKLEDPLLDQFELLGPQMVDLQNEAGTMMARLAAPANGSKPAVPPPAEQQLAQDLETLQKAGELLRLSQSLVPPGAGPLQALRDRVRVYDSRINELQIQGNELERAIQQLRSYPEAIELAKALQQAAQQELPNVEASIELLQSRADERIESLQKLSKRQEVLSERVDLRAFDVEDFRKRLADLPVEYTQIDRRLSAPLNRWDERQRQLAAQRASLEHLLAQFAQLIAPLRAAVDPLKLELDKPGVLQLPVEAQSFPTELNRLVDDPRGEFARFAADFQQVRTLLDSIFQEANHLSQDAYSLGIVQARARLDATRLVPISLEQCTAMRVARENRLDLMNARAGLVDSWRLIQVRADALKAGLDVVFDGQLNTLGDNPFRFRSPTGVLRAGLRWDTPITRLQERNIYRQELIRFQRARRTFINFHDNIDRSLRNILRTIELNQVNFELRRAAVYLAIEQVELAALRLQEPPKPGVVTGGLGVTTARDLIDALSSLLNAQNNYLSVFVNYEQLRMQLDLDLGTLLLDDHGMWIDPGEISDSQFGGCASDAKDGLPEEIPLPLDDPASAALSPTDISTLILLPADEETEAQPSPKPKSASQSTHSAPAVSIPEPRRLAPEAVESAKAVPPAEPRWSTPAPSTGWKTARPVSAQ